MTQNNSPITAGIKPLVKILLENRFIIPRYQRPYAWEKKHVKWFLDDIAYGIGAKQFIGKKKPIGKKKSYHYFGPIMLIDTNDGKLINDGQQRIVTLTLICAYLAKYFADKGEHRYEKRAMRVLFDLPAGHKKTMSMATDQTPRITLSKPDHRIYKSLISSGKSPRKKSPMNMAWKTIDSFLSDKKFPLKLKISFFEFICSDLKVSWTEFKNKKDAITSFVTQNTRGKSLEQIQLTCSHCLRCLDDAEEKSDTVSDHFDYIRDQFKSEKKFFDYTRCFAQCEYGYLSSKDFCVDISEKITDATEAHDFVFRLSRDRNINLFQNLSKKSHDPNYYQKLTKYGGHDKSIRKIADYLRDLDNYKSVSNAIMFALLCQYFNNPSSKKKAKFVCQSSKLLASFFQRAAHSFDRPFAPSQYEENAARLANAITKGACKTSQDFFVALRNFDSDNNIIPNDQYQYRMRSISFPENKAKNDNIKRILIAINEQMEQKSLIVSLEKISVEHILPESRHHLKKKKWNFNESEHAMYRYRLGNLALLPPDAKFSKDPFNESFSAKHDTYRDSEHIITQKILDELSNKKDWEIKTIESRQAKLAKVAAQVWNFDPDHNKKKT